MKGILSLRDQKFDAKIEVELQEIASNGGASALSGGCERKGAAI